MKSTSLRLASGFTLAGLALIAPSSGATFAGTLITFNEPAFPTSQTTLSGNQNYNVLNDSTGAKIATPGELAGLTGDLSDLTMNLQSTTGTLGTNSWQWQPTIDGRFLASHSFTGTVATDNPGRLSSNTITITFGDHLSITDLSMNGSSFNTAGVAWEYTVIEFFRPDGSSFSTAPTIGSYLTHTSIDGSPSAGWYVLDNKGTVTGVGTSQTTTGANPPNENLTVTGGLGYTNVGLAPGTQIGGIRVTTFLEDVRGTGNGSTNFSSSLTEITISGSIVPEPSTAVLALAGLGVAGLYRRRQPCAATI